MLENVTSLTLFKVSNSYVLLAFTDSVVSLAVSKLEG